MQVLLNVKFQIFASDCLLNSLQARFFTWNHTKFTRCLRWCCKTGWNSVVFTNILPFTHTHTRPSAPNPLLNVGELFYSTCVVRAGWIRFLQCYCGNSLVELVSGPLRNAIFFSIRTQFTNCYTVQKRWISARSNISIALTSLVEYLQHYFNKGDEEEVLVTAGRRGSIRASTLICITNPAV